jgi:selenocysteine-specific elongation factor
VYLAPGVEGEAAARLAGLPQPFTLSQARQAWGTSRRVAVPLAEWLDTRGVTVRLPNNTRRLRRA